jgi:hypothetical protein
LVQSICAVKRSHTYTNELLVLLIVLNHENVGTGVLSNKLHGGRGGVGVQPTRKTASKRGSNASNTPLRRVAANQAYRVSGIESELNESLGRSVCFVVVLAVRPELLKFQVSGKTGGPQMSQ